MALAVGTLVAMERDRRMAAERHVEKINALYAEQRDLKEQQQQLAAEKRALELVDDYRAALLRSVSHDLRTPLVTIRAVTSDLRAGAVYDDNVRDELLDLVGDEAERLDRLVANLLSLSRIEAGSLRPELQAVPLEELFVSRVRKLNRVLRAAHVQVDVPFTLPLAEADYTLLDQVITNLLTNAIQYNHEIGEVRITAQAQPGAVVLTVADTGHGIPSEDLPHIFKRFYRADQSRSAGRSGLGLAISKAIVEAHGGTLEVASQPGAGASFTVRLPAETGCSGWARHSPRTIRCSSVSNTS